MEKTNAKKKRNGISIKVVCSILMAITLLLLIFTYSYIENVSNSYNAVASSIDTYILTESNVTTFTRATTYLIENARQFVTTKDIQYLHNYFEELNTIRRREQSLQIIKNKYGETADACTILEYSFNKSNELVQTDIRAMKLVCIAENIDLSTLPKNIQDFELTPSDQKLTNDKKNQLAFDLVYSQKYRVKKTSLENGIMATRSIIMQSAYHNQSETTVALKNSMNTLFTSVLCVLIVVILTFVSIALLIIRPLAQHRKKFIEDKLLDEIGASELRFWARTYNSIYKLNLKNTQTLQFEAEHDALTGLLNRQAYEQFKKNMQNNPINMACILIDLDSFKVINDTMGHEKGDEVLKNVADQLKQTFRNDDPIIRIGGDEFAIFMKNTTRNDKKMISEKIKKINRHLKNAPSNLPEISLSAGVDFSTTGFSQELFQNADKALYKEKENGKCGVCFFGEDFVENDSLEEQQDNLNN